GKKTFEKTKKEIINEINNSNGGNNNDDGSSNNNINVDNGVNNNDGGSNGNDNSDDGISSVTGLTTRQGEDLLVRRSKTDIGSRDINIRGSHLYNQLPRELKNAGSDNYTSF
ncbi:hypothetical protein SK128_004049, partial [Halocaridina rubra]